MRQRDPKDLNSTAINLESLIKLICNYSINPSVNKQLGAALAFNNLYMIFRENENIVDRFWLQLATYFVQSLQMNKNQNSIQQLEEALNHIMRVLIAKNALFNRDSGHRNIPTVLSGKLLKHLVLWIFEQTGHVEIHCRRLCMKMFLTLSVLIDEISDVHMFIKQNPDFFSIESVIKVGESSNFKPSLEYLQETDFTCQDIFNWMNTLYVSVDFYIWIFNNKLFSPIFLFSNKENSNLFGAINYFVQDIIKEELNDLLISLAATSSVNISVKDKEEFVKLKYNILMKVLQLISEILIYDDANQLILNSSWIDNVFNIVVNCLFAPQDLHFNVENNYIGQNYLKNLMEFIEKLRKLLNDSYVQIEEAIIEKLNECINKYFVDPVFDYKSTSLSIATINSLNAICCICKKSFVTRSTFWNSLVNIQHLTSMFLGLTEDGMDTQISIIPDENVVKHYNTMLSIIFEHVDCKDILIDLVLNDTNIIGPIRESRFTHGQHFGTIFSNSILKYLLQFPEYVFDKVINNLFDASAIKQHIIVDFLIRAILYIYRNEKSNQDLVKPVCNTVLNRWAEFIEHVTESDAVDLITYLGMINTNKTDIQNIRSLSDWCINMLVHPTLSLDTKAKILDVLPFITNPKDTNNPELVQALKTFQSLHFPLRSNEFPEGSVKRSSYVCAFNALLNALYTSQSPILLERIIAIIAGNSYNYYNVVYYIIYSIYVKFELIRF